MDTPINMATHYWYIELFEALSCYLLNVFDCTTNDYWGECISVFTNWVYFNRQT